MTTKLPALCWLLSLILLAPEITSFSNGQFGKIMYPILYCTRYSSSLQLHRQCSTMYKRARVGVLILHAITRVILANVIDDLTLCTSKLVVATLRENYSNWLYEYIA